MIEAKVIASNYEVVKTKDGNESHSDHTTTTTTTTATTTKWWTTTRILITVGVSCSVIALAVGLGIGLGMKKTSGTELNIPFLKPPVVSASPQVNLKFLLFAIININITCIVGIKIKKKT